MEIERLSGEKWRLVKTLFHQAAALPRSEVGAFLDRSCGDDPELRDELESLLASHWRAGDFLAESIAFEADEAVQRSERIGPYRIQQKIASGGMGVVYLAVRDDDVFERSVAIKIGGRAPELLERFRQERQILGQLHHPHIAGILDGGALPSGHLYLVMEYVEGETIDAFCASRALAVEERLRLFLRACEAVSYAHQNLVVHRDLKPANIVVTSSGTPKLLDFGIAKLMRAAAGASAAPATILPAMTPSYASPEQVKGGPITTASDVYSLGVLLYELLSGRPPFDFDAESLRDIVEAVCERTPEPPSATLARWSPGERRARALPSSLHPDLDSIVMKALRKEPQHRYPSVGELSRDVRRHLEGLPVEARGNALGYRASRFVLRHKAAAVGTGLLFLSLLAGMTATLRQARIAEGHRLHAEERFEEVRLLANSFLFDFHDAIADLPGSTEARELVVATAVEYLGRLSEDAGEDVALSRELAIGYMKVGDVQGGLFQNNLGRSGEALASYRRAVGLLQSVVGSPGASPRDRLLLAESNRKLADGLRMQGEYAEAARSYRTSRDLAAEVSRTVPGSREAVTELARSSLSLADLQITLGHRGRSMEELENARNAYAMLRDDPEAETIGLSGLGRTLYRMAGLRRRSGDFDGARADAEACLEVFRALVKREPQGVGHRRGLWASLVELALIQKKQGDLDEALATMLRARRTIEPLFVADPMNAQLQRDAIVTEADYGDILAETGDHDEARAALRKALALASTLLAQDESNARSKHILAQVGATFADVLVRAGELEAARLRLNEALALEGTFPPASRSAETLGLLAAANARLAMALLEGARSPRHRDEVCERLHASRELLSDPGKLLFPDDAALSREVARELDACGDP